LLQAANNLFFGAYRSECLKTALPIKSVIGSDRISLRRCAVNQSCDEHYHHLRGDLDWNADRETKLAVGAPSVDGDFDKPV
jgi:hypothetical protein